MKRIALAALASLALAAGARAEDGKAIYDTKCKSCHGPDGTGSPMGVKMGVKDLTKVGHESQDELVKAIENGKPPKMTAYKGKLSDAEIQAVAKYVKTGLAK